jgi:hypothetical protein
LMLSFLPPKKGGSKAQNFTNTWEAKNACEFHSSSLNCCHDSGEIPPFILLHSKGQLLFQMHDDTNTMRSTK